MHIQLSQISVLAPASRPASLVLILRQLVPCILVGASAATDLNSACTAALQPVSTFGNGSTASLQDGRFVRAAKAVGDCLSRVKTLSESVNSAASFRESCSKVLGAAFAASLALQEVRG